MTALIILAIVVAFAVVALFTLGVLMARAPVGWEDELGFHYGEPPE